MQSELSDLSAFASQLAADAVENLPRILTALAVLIVGWFIARIAAVGTRRMLRSFNAVMLRNWRQQVGSGARLSPATIGISAAIVQWTLLFIVVAGVTRILGIEALSEWFGKAVDHLPSLIAGAVIVFVGVVASQFARDLIVALLQPSSGDQAKVFGSLTQVMVVVTTLVMGVGQAGVDITLLVSIVTIVLGGLFGGMALAFGLGARDLVANLIGTHHAQKLFTVGQTIRVGEARGQVVRVTATATVLSSQDGQTVVPGSLFQREAVIVVQTQEDDDE